MHKTSIVHKFTGLMFLVILGTVSILLTLANWQMTDLFHAHIAQSPTPSEERLLASVHDSLIWVGVVMLLFGLAASYLLARRITDPLRRLSSAAEQIGKGRYDTVILATGNDEVAQLARSLQAMTEALRANRRMQQRLLADIAHELKTPLSVIQGNLEGMMEDVVPCDKEQLASLHEETIHLKRLITDLRDLSLAETGQLQIELTPTQIGSVIERVVTMLKPMAEEKKIQIVFEDSVLPIIKVDSVRITQVIYNLIINAIRYSQPKGRIEIATKVEKRDGSDWIVTRVIDNGIGISPADIPFLFDHFYRVDTSRDRRSGGTGIGLAIVKQLVELHGGQVGVVSEQGKGSVFQFSLPIAIE